MVKRNRTARKARISRSRDLERILGRFSDARCVLECAVRSLEEWHDLDTGVGDETVCLRHGLDLLGAVYNDLDMAMIALASDRAGGKTTNGR
jgi:hypothetical protein